MMAVAGRVSRALPAVASLRDGLRPPWTPVPPPLLLVEGAAPGAGPGAAGRLARARPRPQAGGRLRGAAGPGWARPRLGGHQAGGVGRACPGASSFGKGAARLVMMAAPGWASRALPAVASLRDGLRPPWTPVPPPLLPVEGAAPGAGPRGSTGCWSRSAPGRRPVGRCGTRSLRDGPGPGSAAARPVGCGARSLRDGPGTGQAAAGCGPRGPLGGPRPAQRPQTGGRGAVRSG